MVTLQLRVADREDAWVDWREGDPEDWVFTSLEDAHTAAQRVAAAKGISRSDIRLIYTYPVADA